jgi:hypothetical protein
MPSKGLREALEEPIGCSGGEGYRSLDNVSFCLGSLSRDALIRAVGTSLLRERTGHGHTQHLQGSREDTLVSLGIESDTNLSYAASSSSLLCLSSCWSRALR